MLIDSARTDVRVSNDEEHRAKRIQRCVERGEVSDRQGNNYDLLITISTQDHEHPEERPADAADELAAVADRALHLAQPDGMQAGELAPVAGPTP